MRHTDITDTLVREVKDARRVRPDAQTSWPVVSLLWKKRNFVLRTACCALVLTAALSMLLPKRFTSKAQFLPGDSNSGNPVGMMARALSGSGLTSLPFDLSGLVGAKAPGAVFVAILQSRTVADSLIDRFNLRQVYRTRYYESARKALENRTRITEDRKSGAITLEVSDSDPKRAAAIAQAYLDEMNHLSSELNTSAAHRERVFLEQRLQAAKQDLNIAARELTEFSSKNTTIDVKEQGKAMVESAAALQGQLIAAETEARSLEQLYTPDNVRVRAVHARISEILRQMRNVAGVPLETNSGSSEATSVGDLYPPIRKLPLLAQQYAEYYRRAKVTETVFELLTQQYELAKIEEAKELPSIKVLDQPDVPEHKSFPPRTLIVLSGTALSAVLACFWVVAVDRWRHMPLDNPNRQFVQFAIRDFRSDLQQAKTRVATILRSASNR